jgi:transcriptional pleiotropic regulator of transition state genes
MKSTGIVRKLDELGRIVLPVELRRTFNIAEKDALEIYVDESTIILKKYEPACIFCANAKGVQVYKGKNICPDCMKELKGDVVTRTPSCMINEKTANKAQDALNQLSQGKKTINQVRYEYGLDSHSNTKLNAPITRE